MAFVGEMPRHRCMAATEEALKKKHQDEKNIEISSAESKLKPWIFISKAIAKKNKIKNCDLPAIRKINPCQNMKKQP